ncbi:MAG TPA: hypothetical protein VM943_08655 [Pyrinomonadaceae bacterium]|nr:hypothetical protein [Pyrinomonadaceae bacterium]
MSLAEARVKIEVNEVDFVDAAAAIEGWRGFTASVVSHHGEQCCHLAREWFLSTDYSQLNAGTRLTGPRWLRLKYTWGPSSWPLHWCEAAGRKTLDCGGLAAVAHELFVARGVKSYPAQLIQQYTVENALHWSMNWDGAFVPANWIKDDLIYHEACVVEVRDDEIRVWDPTASWWINPKQFGGYGGLLALRVFASSESPRIFKWGRHDIIPNLWQKIESARADFA